MYYVQDLLEHLAVVRGCGEQLGFRSAVGVSNLALDIEKSGLRFQPGFSHIDVSQMPSLSQNKDDPAFKSGLVWPGPQLVSANKQGKR